MAFQNDDDKKWFLLSHMNKGTALEIVNWIRSDLPHNFDNKSYAQFTSILAGLFEDPTERQTAMAKLDTLKQGGKGLVEFIAEFDLLVMTAGYKLPDVTTIRSFVFLSYLISCFSFYLILLYHIYLIRSRDLFVKV